MKKSVRSLAVLGVCALSLTSCGKVSFADFQTKAKEALNTTVEYKSASVSGTVKNTGEVDSNEKDISASLAVNGHVLTPATVTSVSDIAAAAYVNLFGIGTFSATEISGYTYYAGSSFKVTYTSTDENNNKSNSTIKWNKYGLVTSIVAKGSGASETSYFNLTIKYSK